MFLILTLSWLKCLPVFGGFMWLIWVIFLVFVPICPLFLCLGLPSALTENITSGPGCLQPESSVTHWRIKPWCNIWMIAAQEHLLSLSVRNTLNYVNAVLTLQSSMLMFDLISNAITWRCCKSQKINIEDEIWEIWRQLSLLARMTAHSGIVHEDESAHVFKSLTIWDLVLSPFQFEIGIPRPP